MSSNVLVLDNLKYNPTPGVDYRLLCLNGERKGTVYYLKGERIMIGRSREADIPIYDTKSSREHAELKKYGQTYVVTDLGSQNGVIVNDEKIKQHTLQEGDRIIIGSTIFKFDRSDAGRGAKTPFKIAKKPIGTHTQKQSSPPMSPKKRMLMIVVGFLFVMIMFDDGPSNTEKKKNKNESSSNIPDDFTNAVINQKLKEDKEIKQKLKTIFQRGLREYREGNYFRAINEFNLALILSPNNSRASFYLNKTKQALDEEIEANFIKAKRDVEALKYQNAIISYCSIVRLLYNYPNDSRYKDALANIKEVEKLIGYEPGSTKCL